MNRYFDLDDLKTNIFLPELMKENGYELVRAKSSRTHLFMQSSGRSLVVYKNRRGHWVYFDVHSNIKHFDPEHPENTAGQTTTGQTIIDFIMMEYPNTNFNQAAKIAFKYRRTGEFISTDNPAFNVEAGSFFQPDTLFNITQRSFKPLGEYSQHYFQARSINPDIIRHPVFNNVFHEWLVSYDGMAKNKENTIGTRMIFEDGKIACLLSSKIGRKTFAFGKKSESLWYTNPEICREGIDYFFAAESWQDAVAHYEMNVGQLEGKKVLYASCQGNISPKQILFLERIIKERKPAQMTTLFDNDPQGIKYTCNLLNKVSEDQRFDVELSVSKTEATGFISSEMNEKDFTQSINQHFGKTTEINISRISDGNHRATFSFPIANEEQENAAMPALRQFIEGVYQIKNIPEQFRTEYSAAKDFNDDLKILKAKEKQEFKNNIISINQ